MITDNHPERIGYSNQKLLLLTQRIIELASIDGYNGLDLFVGVSTTIVLAYKFNCRWMSIDQIVQTNEVTYIRMNVQQD